MKRLLAALILLSLAPAQAQDVAPLPPAPSGPRLEATRPGLIVVHWPAAPGAKHLWRRIGTERPWERIATLEPDHTRFADPLAAGLSASYRVDMVGGKPGPVIGPAQALDPFYVELRGVERGRATIHVHKWDKAYEEWLRSDPLTVSAGEPLGKNDMLADFRTGATVLGAGPSALDPSVTYIRFKTEGGRELKVTSRDTLPTAVYAPKVKKQRETKPEEPKVTRVRKKYVKPPPTEKTLKFPAPKKVGSAPGRKVIWEITNRSEMSMTIAITGQSARRLFKVGPDKTYTVKFKRGDDFKILATAANNKILPLVGEFGLESGSLYSTELAVRVLDPKEVNERKVPVPDELKDLKDPK